MEILEWLQLASVNASNGYGHGNTLFLVYAIVSISIKKSRYLLAFFISEFIVSSSLFDKLPEYQLYLTMFVVYSYMVTLSKPLKIKVSCAIMCGLSLVLFRDALYYGVGGIYGERQTVLYQNIEYIAFVAHIIIILSLIPYGRIYDGICSMLDHAFGRSANSYNLSFFWYTMHKTQEIKT